MYYHHVFSFPIQFRSEILIKTINFQHLISAGVIYTFITYPLILLAEPRQYYFTRIIVNNNSIATYCVGVWTTVTSSYRVKVLEQNGLLFIRAFILEILDKVQSNSKVEFVFCLISDDMWYQYRCYHRYLIFLYFTKRRRHISDVTAEFTDQPSGT